MALRCYSTESVTLQMVPQLRFPRPSLMSAEVEISHCPRLFFRFHLLQNFSLPSPKNILIEALSEAAILMHLPSKSLCHFFIIV